MTDELAVNATLTGETVTLQERIEWAIDSDPLKLRDALFAVLARLDAEVAGAERQMAMGDYRTCPPDMLRIYCHEAIDTALGEPR